MAVIKLWNISHKAGRSDGKQMKDSVNYIMDEIKTSLSVPIEISIADEIGNGMSEMEAVELRDAMNEIKYLTNGKKTVEGFFTGAMNCRLEHAITEMQELKKLYRKKEGRILTCGVISFTEKDQDLAKCWAAGKAMLREIYGENYQVVYSMHTNTKHPHIHFLINTVGLDGKKLHMKQGYVREVLQPVVNRYCRAYDLAVNENFGKKKAFEKKLTNSEIAIDMDAAIEKAESLPEFVTNMKLMGYRVSVGKSLTVQREDMGKGRWTNLVGADYSLERVMERIRDKRKRPDPANLEGISKGVISKQNGRVLIPAVRWKNMTGFQKENVRLLFQQGRNPFREQWVNQRMQQRNRKLFEERRQAFVCVKHGILEPGGMDTALQKIRERQEELAERKRVITEPLKKQKAMFKLVRRAEELETRVISGIMDHFYESEQKEFARIIDRLKRNFGQDYTELKEYRRMAVESERSINRELEQLKKEAGVCYAAMHRVGAEIPKPLTVEKEKTMDIKESLMMQQNTKEPDKKNEDRIPEVPEHMDREVEDIVEKYGELAELQNELKKQKEQEEAECERKRKQKEQRERNLHRSFHI